MLSSIFRLELALHKMVKIVFLFGAIFSVSPLFADSSIVSTTEEFVSTPYAAGFVPQEPYSAAWQYQNSTYLVWVDAAFRPWITQVTNGKATTVPLDANPDYTTQPDGHHRYSIGIDKAGYIHVTGDMHHYMDQTVSVINPYPVRYQKQAILYWKSNKPGDVTSGFTFAGGIGTSTAIPGSGWMMGRFFSDNNNELFYSSQVHAYESLTNHGQMAVGLYKYNTATQTWAAIGGVAPFTDAYLSHIEPVFYWENSGSNSGPGTKGGWFQNYQAHFTFDSTNRMYFSVTSNTDETLSGANRIIFAMSDDGGVTWKRANGTAITGFPIRGIDGLTATGDIVTESKVSPFFGALVGLTVDKNNKPGVSVNYTWWVWNGTAWTNNTAQNFPTLPIGALGYRLPDKSLIIGYSNISKIIRTASFDAPSVGYDFSNYSGIASIDDYTLKTSGALYNIGAKSNGTEALLKTTITPAPLPTGWKYQDIDTVSTVYGGNVGYANNAYVMTSYGIAIDNQTTDSFTYAYEPMMGDGSITARVTVPQSNARAGVMMRETLDPASKQVSSILYPYPNKMSGRFVYRSATGGQPLNVDTPGISLPYWVRLVRAGDVFTAFISPDGITWKQTQSTTVPMNKNIYVGLAGASYQNYWFMQTITFDNVTAPVAICTRANPLLAISPANQTGSAGGNVNYTLTLTNNDTATCGPSTFNFSSVADNGVTGGLSALSLAVAPGASGSVTLNMNSLTSTPANIYNATVKAVNALATTFSGTATGVYKVTGDCTLQPPTLTYAPSTQTTYGTTPVNYSVSVVNNDTSACVPRLFSFSTSASNYNLGTFMEPYNVSIAPGQTVYTQVTVTPQIGITAGSYTLSTTSQNGGSASANVVYTTATCTHANPAITFSPSSIAGKAGGTATYSVNITNNDAVMCGSSTFNLNALIPSGMSGKLNVSSVAIAPGGTAVTTLNVTSLAAAPSANYGVSVNATNTTATTFTGTATANYQVTGGCVLQSPTMMYTPSTQSTSSMIPVNYSVSILNNDTSTCVPRPFSFSTVTSSSFLTTSMVPSSVNIAPGQTVASQVTVTPSIGITPGTYTLSSSSPSGGSAKASLVYSARH
jgi:hypothetical protein